MLPLLFLVLGLLAAAGAVWLRLGRTEGARSWVGHVQQERMVLVTLPSVALALVGVAALLAGDHGTLTSLGALLVGVGVVAILVFNAAAVRLPRWSLPGWYLTRTEHRRERGRRAP